MKKCPECNSSSFTIGSMFKAHFFAQRIYCKECETEFEFGEVNFILDLLLFNGYFTFLPIIVFIYGLATLSLLPIVISAFVIFLVYYLHVNLSPLKSVGLRAELKKRA